MSSVGREPISSARTHFHTILRVHDAATHGLLSALVLEATLALRLLAVLVCSHSLLDPLLDNFLLCIDKDETLLMVIHASFAFFLLLRLLLHLLLAALIAIDLNSVLIVRNLGQNLRIALLQCNLHHMGEFTSAELWGTALDAQELIRRESTLVDAGNLIYRNKHSGPVREALKCEVILVDEDGMLVQHEVPLDDVVMLLCKLADWALNDYSVISIRVHHFPLLILLLLEYLLENF